MSYHLTLKHIITKILHTITLKFCSWNLQKKSFSICLQSSSIWLQSFILQVQTTKEVLKPEKASLGEEDVVVRTNTLGCKSIGTLKVVKSLMWECDHFCTQVYSHTIMVFIYHIYLENCTPVANLKNAWQEQLGKTFSFSDFWCWECVVKSSVVLINPFGITCNQKKNALKFFFFDMVMEKCSIKTRVNYQFEMTGVFLQLKN